MIRTSFLFLILTLAGLSYAQITSPVPTGTVIDWALDGSSPCNAPIYYRIDVGSSVGGSDYGTTGLVSDASGTFGTPMTGPYSADLSMTAGITLPTDGTLTANVRLWALSTNCGWRTFNLVITLPPAPPPPMVMPVDFVSPACGEEVGGETTFTWTPGDFTVIYWRVDVGTSPGASDVASTGLLPGATLMATLFIDSEGLAASGTDTVYVRLWYFSGGWKILDCVSTVGGGGGPPPPPACMGDIEVTDGSDSGPNTLRQAVLDAASGNIICVSTNVSLASEININKNLTIIGNGVDITISASGTNRLLTQVDGSGSTLNLENLTFSGGDGGSSFLSGRGGAIMVGTGSTANLTDCIVTGNSGSDSGGGGLYNRGTLTLDTCTVSGNTSTTTGGALVNESPATFSATDSTFAGNSAMIRGAGIDSTGGMMTLTRCTISGNMSSSATTVITVLGTATTIESSTITGNSASSGTLITVTGGGSLALESSTVVSNPTAAALNVEIGTSLTLHNSIVADHSVNFTGIGMTSSLGFNVYDSNPGFAAVSDFTGVPFVVIGLLPLGSYGGPTETMPPCETSFVIGIGDSSLTTTDQRGNTRPVNPMMFPAGVDTGAVERVDGDPTCT